METSSTARVSDKITLTLRNSNGDLKKQVVVETKTLEDKKND